MKNVILYFLMIGLSTTLYSQGLFNDYALISISDDVIMTVGTDFTNEGGVINNGVLSLQGDWQNNGSYVEEGGRVVLSGFNDQTVYADSLNFSDLTIAGSGDKTLAFNTVLTGVLDFTSGRLKVADDTLILSEDLKLYGVNDQSYIVGRVFRTGEGVLDFPIGTSSQYLPVVLLDVEGTDPLIAMEALDTLPNQSIGNNIDVATDRCWVMTKDENYVRSIIKLPFNNDFAVLDTANIVVAQSTSDFTDFNTLGAELVDWGFEGGGVVTSSGLANGPYFTIGYTGLEETLPPVRVINALTPRQDGKHDFMRVENIELYEDNEVKIYDRQGGLVWKKTNYDNYDIVFRGTANVGSGEKLADGNYFYTIQHRGKRLASGFVFLKR